MANPIYNFLVENNLTKKSESEFLQEYKDPAKAQTLYNFMSENGLTEKGFDTFYSEYFPVGELNEVSSQGSEVTSGTSGSQSSNSAEPSAVIDVTGINTQVNPDGTFITE